MANKRSPPKKVLEADQIVWPSLSEGTRDIQGIALNGNVYTAEEIGLQAPLEKGTSRMKVDLSGISLTPAPRAKGDYPGRLINHELRLASGASGQPTLNLHFEDLQAPGKVIYTNYSMQPQSLWKWKRDMIRLGADVATMNDKSADVEEIVRSLYGYEAVLEFGEPRPDSNDPEKVYSNFLGVKDPTKP